ncbi:MAG: hypothetical protein ABSA96_08510 [Candidatus Acidiferrales bacterium]|jgi:hypothetical protein
MKLAGKIVGAILICSILLLLALRITGLDPKERRPGLWLTGTVVTTPVTDWSFATQFETDRVQTRTWYLIPHSVTTGFRVYKGQLYLTSRFAKGVPFPQGKSWDSNVMRDPHVRLKFGDRLYDCVLTHVTDPAEKAAVLGDTAASAEPDGATMHLFHAVSE